MEKIYNDEDLSLSDSSLSTITSLRAAAIKQRHHKLERSRSFIDYPKYLAPAVIASPTFSYSKRSASTLQAMHSSMTSQSLSDTSSGGVKLNINSPDSTDSKVTLGVQSSPTDTGTLSEVAAEIQPNRNSQSSVKHLTCFWWREKGTCRFSDEDCLYAHHDTGYYTEPPRQIIPGEPAMAGRKLHQAMRNLVHGHPSATSVTNFSGSRHGSRPSTPVVDPNPAPPPSLASQYQHHHLHQQQHSDAEFVRINRDNQFLRNLVEQNGKEKAVMINHIETLQAENKNVKTTLEELKTTQEHLIHEREGLRIRVRQLENQFAGVGGRSFSSPFGPVGSYTTTTSHGDRETRYLGGLLDE